jgi:hypothetical protein
MMASLKLEPEDPTDFSRQTVKVKVEPPDFPLIDVSEDSPKESGQKGVVTR